MGGHGSGRDSEPAGSQGGKLAPIPVGPMWSQGGASSGKIRRIAGIWGTKDEQRFMIEPLLLRSGILFLSPKILLQEWHFGATPPWHRVAKDVTF